MSSRDLGLWVDADLVVRAQAGYLDAFEVLVRRHSPRLHRVAHSILGDAEGAAVVVQYSLLAGWQSLAGFRDDTEGSTVIGWLQAIVRRVLWLPSPGGDWGRAATRTDRHPPNHRLVSESA